MYVEVDPDEKQSDGGIWLGVAQIERDDALTGTVLAVGQGVKKRGSECIVGDRVVFPKECGTLVDLGDSPNERLMIRESMLLLIYRQE